MPEPTVKHLTCIQCPKGCRLAVALGPDGSVTTVEGNGCDLGPVWAKKEVEDPVRTLTTSVRVLRGKEDLVSVRTSGAIPRRLVAEALSVAKELRIEAPVALGRVVAENLAGTGVSLVATRAVDRSSGGPRK
jgi:CxxC motif-containing protein